MSECPPHLAHEWGCLTETERADVLAWATAQVRAETLQEAAREFDVLADFFIQQAMTLKTDGARQTASAAAVWRQQAAGYLRDLASAHRHEKTT